MFGALVPGREIAGRDIDDPLPPLYDGREGRVVGLNPPEGRGRVCGIEGRWLTEGR
jgi:hypothetical protein